MGRKQRQSMDLEEWQKPATLPLCPLCGRLIPPEQSDEHHLIPKLKGGKVTQALHRICHRQVHALLTESELAKHYNSPEALLEHPEIQKFVAWVRKKPNDYLGSVKGSRRTR